MDVQDNLIVTDLTVLAGERRIISELTCSFQAGTVTLVIGRSGTGKTLLLETLSGLREPGAGQIQVGTEPLWFNQRARRKLNRRVLLLLGTAFQHPEHQLFARSVREEFVYTLSPYKLRADERVRRIETVYKDAQGQDGDWMQRDPFTMSGGEKRRLAHSLLRAAQPQWLLLDEPTAGVDQEGVSLLCRQLQEWKQDGKGAVVVTHDFDHLQSAADRVLILYDGRVVWDGTPGELSEHSHVLEDAGLALSERLETLRRLRQSGISLPGGWVYPRAAAEAIARGLSAAVDAAGTANDADSSEVDLREERDQGEIGPSLEKGFIQTAPLQTRRISHCMKRDPLAVWLSYILISTGILLQPHWMGWLAGTFVTLAVIAYSGVPFREWSKPALGFFTFMLIASGVSGLTIDFLQPSSGFNGFTLPWGYLSGLGFAVDPAIETFFRFGRLIMVMLSGFVLLSGISHLHLKRALEQRLYGLRYLRFPVNQFALVASLMVRFLPTLVDEWHRFARISAARGKYPVRPGSLPIRRIYRTAVPFLMSLLRLGETWSLVLMSRGVGREGWEPTRAVRMKLDRQDVYLVASAAGILIVLFFIKGLHL